MAESNLKKEANGYGYKYTDLAQIHTYLEGINTRYYQYVERMGDDDYIFTVPIIDGEELPARRGCRVVQATLKGNNNPAQEQGSALTYARRYSLLLAFGLATTDDDAQLLNSKTDKAEPKKDSEVASADIRAKAFKELNKHSKEYIQQVCDHYKIKDIKELSNEQAEDFIRQVEDKKK